MGVPDITDRWLDQLLGRSVGGVALLGIVVLAICATLIAPKYISKIHSPSAKVVNEKAGAHPSAKVFPPSRRAALAQLLPASKIVTTQNILPTPDLKKNQLPTTKTQDLGKKDQFTPTGISTQEIEALGRFPDYSVLSGVRHPTPDPSFDIHKAVFRPFRPFRWAYHQTMGESCGRLCQALSAVSVG
jgi:hypothetical protein